MIPIRPPSCTDPLFLKSQKLRLPRLRIAQKCGGREAILHLLGPCAIRTPTCCSKRQHEAENHSREKLPIATGHRHKFRPMYTFIYKVRKNSSNGHSFPTLPVYRFTGTHSTTHTIEVMLRRIPWSQPPPWLPRCSQAELVLQVRRIARNYHPGKLTDFDALSRYGWSWQPELAADANYMDLAYLIARNSTAMGGHMGSVIVAGIEAGMGDQASTQQLGEVTLCTINTPLFGAFRTDCHAEANAVSECARRGLSIRGLSCYVTKAPCVSCFKLLATSGIGRIVQPDGGLTSRHCTASAEALGIEVISLRDMPERAARRDLLGRSNEDMGRVLALRLQRKRIRAEKAVGKAERAAARGAGGDGAATHARSATGTPATIDC